MSSETNLQLFPGIFRSTVGGETPGFFLHSDGRVGIGNKAPTARPTWDTDLNSTEKNKLNVSGHTHIDGNLNVTGSVYGDGSNMTGVALPWAQSTPNLATDIKYEGGNVGIGGVASGTEALTVYGDLNLKSGGQLKLNGQTSAFSNWSVDGSDIYRSTGNVGIGTDDPQGGLHVQADNRVHITAGTVAAFTGTTASSSTGTSRAQLVLNSRYSDLVIASSYVNNNHGSTLSFATVNPSNAAEYRKFVINQGNWGSRKDFLDFGLSASTADANPHLSINSTDTVLTLDGNNKRVGIGTISPHVKLHVNGGSNPNISYTNRSYFQSNYVSLNRSVSNWTQTTSIYATHDIVSKQTVVVHNGVIGASDERIKKEIVDVEDGSALETLRLLKPKKYKYVDEVQRGTEPVWGFIAQEVRETLPYATQLRTDCLPNIYELANVSNSNVITFTNFDTSNLESNAMVLKVYDEDDTEHLVNIVEVVGEHSVRVDEDLTEWIGTVEGSEGDKIFVYGQQVDDFVFLKKEAIWTVATSALQEVDHQLQAEKEKVASLEERLAALEAIVLNQ